MPSSYNYPASHNAKGTYQRSDLIRNNDKIEAYILNKALKVTGLTQGNLVDIGTGEGRYALFFGQNAKKVYLIEPDKPRLAKAVNNLSHIKAQTIEINGTVEDARIDNATIDVVINVHVLQHIHPDEVERVLTKSSDWLKPGGQFVLCFTKKTKFDNDYNVSWSENNKGRYSPIPKSLFDLITKTNPEGALPVRKLHLKEITSRLEDLGLRVEYLEEYSPRLIDLQKTIIGKSLLGLYKRVSPLVLHRILSEFGYSKFIDVCIVARKA